jgi:transglutaminase-like putative cysteine protease
MTSAVSDVTPRFTRWRRRFVQEMRSLFNLHDLLTLFIVFVAMLMPLLSLVQSGWPLLSNVAVPVLFLSIVFGFMLARSQYNELVALIMSMVYGASTVFVFAAWSEPGNILEGAVSLVARVAQWLIDAVSGGINQDDLIFTLLVSALLWFLGYSAVWHVFRIDRVWRAVLPPALILVVNSVYYAGDAPLDRYLVVFLFMALLLMARSSLDAREWDWYVNGIRVPRNIRQQFLRVGAIFALITLMVAWAIPSDDLQERLNDFQEFMAAEPLTELGELWNRLFSSADVQGPATADYYGGDSLQLGGAIQLGEQKVFSVAAPPGRRYYWRSRVFDTYESGRWLPAANTRLSAPQSPLEIVNEPLFDGARIPVQQTFTTLLRASRLIYTAPQPSRIDLPTRTDLRYFGQDDSFMNVSVIRPTNVLTENTQYSVTSLLSNANAHELRSASAEYPQWVRDLYLYVSPSVTTRTTDLARMIVSQANATTPYDQAKAIETWLRVNMRYNESIPQPSGGQDPVDWFLFDIQEGYCNYYASAMIVMLRSLGIPARMAAGFAQGTWEVENGRYLVRERDAHTWVEVYFPGYGWVEFEPTAAQSPLDRTGDEERPEPTPPPMEITATPTPTLSPTPSPTPTTDMTVIPPDQEGLTLPTLTPTPTPSPTATPVIIPPMQAMQEQTIPPSPWAMILSLLGAIFAALLVILLIALILVFIWWWWEWRGMRGLNPIERAYARLERYLPLAGVELSEKETPTERRWRIVRVLPMLDAPVTTITEMYIAQRYGRRAETSHPDDPNADLADDAWAESRSGILRRWLARLIPWKR